MKIDKLKQAAKENYSLGLNIIPVFQKTPIFKWTEYQNRRQTEQEFNNIIWEEADGFALIGGSQLKNGKYLGAIDYDVKNLAKEIVEKGKRGLDYLPITAIEETPSKGQHYIYHCTKKPRTIGIHHKDCGIEQLGKKKLIIMDPSNGYKKLNDKTPTKIEDLEEQLDDALIRSGIGVIEVVDKWIERDSFTSKGYKGKDPECILKLAKGVTNGERNEIAIRLASYQLNFKKLSPTKALPQIKQWNNQNKPPLNTVELEAIFTSAKKGNYIYGCQDPVLKQHCKKAKCPLAKKEPIVPLNLVQKEVKRIFENENYISEINKHLDNIIAGEQENKLAILVLLLSGKFKEGSMKQMILLKGTAGSGKSTLMKIADLFKTKDVGRFSQHALDYTDLSGFEVLRLKELGNMDEEKYGISTIKFLSNDDKGYKVEVTVRDKDTGRFTTDQIIIPPMTIISSTTRFLLDAQYERRNWIPSADESQAQTTKVLKFKVKQKQEMNEIALGLRQYTSRDFSVEVLRYLVNSLKQCKVIIPFCETLASLLNTNILRTRGDYDKIHTFVLLYSFLNQHKMPNNHKTKDLIVLATPRICIEALRIVEPIILTMTSGLEKRSRELFDVLRLLGITKSGNYISKSEREKIANLLGKDDRTIRYRLLQFENAGYLIGDGKRPKTYKLLWDLDGIERKCCSFSAKIELADDLILEMSKEAQKWRSSQLEKGNEWIGEEYKLDKEEKSNDGIEFRVIPSEDITIKEEEDKKNK